MNQETKRPLHCKVTVRIMTDEKAFGPGVAALLNGIDETGSLQGAAHTMGMSYSKAWNIVKEAEKIWGFPLTQRQAGGPHGGHSTLTPAARILLQRYDAMEEKVRETAREQFSLYFNPQEIQKLKEFHHAAK